MADNYISRRDKIIASAIDLIGDAGLHALSTKNLALRENVSETLVYKYFGGIDEVLVEVVKQYVAFDDNIQKTKFRQLRDDLAIFLFGTLRNVLRLLRGQVEFDRQVLFKRSGKQRPHARRLSKILNLLSPFRVRCLQLVCIFDCRLAFGHSIPRAGALVNAAQKSSGSDEPPLFSVGFTCPDRRDTGTSRSPRACSPRWG